MIHYYLCLALLSFRRNWVLTALMVAAIGVGIASTMTTLTMFRAMNADPIPAKSRQLFAVQIDNWGPTKTERLVSDDKLALQLSYTDAIGLMNASVAVRQTATYAIGFALLPSNPLLRPFQVQARATYADFFQMFDVPFRYGTAWSREDDNGRAHVVVISRELNDKVFGGANSVGNSVNLDGEAYRVVGVLDRWEPLPKFYDLNNYPYGKTEDALIPFTRAIEGQMSTWGNNDCSEDSGAPGWQGHLQSECVWIQFWAELSTLDQVRRYRTFLDSYASDQQRLGRFHWPARTRLRDIPAWLDYQHAVTGEVRILVLLSFSFLTVCLLNAMGMMLAKVMGRARDIGLRRALGADRAAIYTQCLIEAGVVGFAGGLVGLALTALGLLGVRTLLSEQIARLSHLDAADVLLTFAIAVIATTVIGLYPTWRASQIQPVGLLKTS
jgi:putative ABC transport system permease protein